MRFHQPTSGRRSRSTTNNQSQSTQSKPAVQTLSNEITLQTSARRVARRKTASAPLHFTSLVALPQRKYTTKTKRPNSGQRGKQNAARQGKRIRNSNRTPHSHSCPRTEHEAFNQALVDVHARLRSRRGPQRLSRNSERRTVHEAEHHPTRSRSPKLLGHHRHRRKDLLLHPHGRRRRRNRIRQLRGGIRDHPANRPPNT